MIRKLSWSLPLAIITIAAGWWSLIRQESAMLSMHLAELQSQADRLARSRSAASPPSAPPSIQDDFRVASTLGDIASEREQLTKIKRAADALAARLPVAHADEIITSFGKIKDMGRETGGTLRDFIAQAAQAPDTQTATNSAVLRMMHLQGRLPEIRAFEQHPDEIASFQSNALEQALDLTPEATARAKALVRAAFSDIAARHLTAIDRPAGDDSGWQQLRSGALQGLMQQLRPLLPQNGSTNSEKTVLMLVLNLGAGFDQDTKSEPDKATITWGMKWPEVPW